MRCFGGDVVRKDFHPPKLDIDWALLKLFKSHILSLYIKVCIQLPIWILFWQWAGSWCIYDAYFCCWILVFGLPWSRLPVFQARLAVLGVSLDTPMDEHSKILKSWVAQEWLKPSTSQELQAVDPEMDFCLPSFWFKGKEHISLLWFVFLLASHCTWSVSQQCVCVCMLNLPTPKHLSTLACKENSGVSCISVQAALSKQLAQTGAIRGAIRMWGFQVIKPRKVAASSGCIGIHVLLLGN